ncbi:conserved hypothetical protein [Solidesulfovibrio fructosivorans JJ]]|uniref:Uncharacterized protein n=1 Tax=Solidesulfovibrio fructosivorans JJ] TaxID=596151 RepID=E1JU33_SOLFR|nr:hypothetical protein [Solidesulfovibrio fructosivorans]EFL51963.1 conserved hypothetical protein [Solidesulfovibrio fructosivorans JJ]]
MTKIASFTKLENALVPRFRESMSRAQSTADAQKFFVYTMLELLNSVLADAAAGFELRYEDIWLTPDDEAGPGYALSPRLAENEALAELLASSDLPAILARFAAVAVKRYQYLAQKPEKTEAKMYHGTGRAAR